jgi:hypothetical protein
MMLIGQIFTENSRGFSRSNRLNPGINLPLLNQKASTTSQPWIFALRKARGRDIFQKIESHPKML